MYKLRCNFSKEEINKLKKYSKNWQKRIIFEKCGIFLTYKKENSDVITLMEYLDTHYPEGNFERCNFCNSIKQIKDFKIIIKNDEIYITNIIYKTDKYICGIKPEYAYKKCERLNYNTNSIIYVSKAYNVSESEALKIIHKRNKSPFYKENHQSEEEYKNYQRRDKKWFEENGKDFEKYKEKNKIYTF